MRHQNFETKIIFLTTSVLSTLTLSAAGGVLGYHGLVAGGVGCAFYAQVSVVRLEMYLPVCLCVLCAVYCVYAAVASVVCI